MATNSEDLQPVSCVSNGPILIAIVLGIAVFNALIFWWTNGPDRPDWLAGLIIGAWVFEPMLFAIWMALGPGRFLIRLTLVIPCLLLVIAAPGLPANSFDQVQRHEFLGIAIAAFVSLFLTTVLLLLVQRFTSLRIGHFSGNSMSGVHRFQFGTRYLLLMITLYAIAIGTTSSLKLESFEPNSFLGPGFYAHMIAIGTACISFVVLPIVALTLIVLHSRPKKQAVQRVAVGWLIVTLVAIWFCRAIDDDEEMVRVPLLLQLGAAIVGVAAAVPLRLAGYRLRAQPNNLTAINSQV